MLKHIYLIFTPLIQFFYVVTLINWHSLLNRPQLNWFSLSLKRFSLQLKWFSLQLNWFSLQLNWFSLSWKRFSLSWKRFSLQLNWFSLQLKWFSLQGKSPSLSFLQPALPRKRESFCFPEWPSMVLQLYLQEAVRLSTYRSIVVYPTSHPMTVFIDLKCLYQKHANNANDIIFRK